MLTITDDYDHAIKIGSLCVYNCSGRIAVGQVVKIDIKEHDPTSYHQIAHVIHIRKIGGKGNKNGKISKVKYTNLKVIIKSDIAAMFASLQRK